MRGKRNEMPVVVEIKRSRGRPKKGFMPPVIEQAALEAAAILGDEWEQAELEQMAKEQAALEDMAAEMKLEDAEPALEEERATGSADGMDDESGATDEAPGEPITTGVLGNPDTLAGDIRDKILNQIRRQQKPWSTMLNYEQAVLADQIYKISKESVAGALRIILDVPFQHVDVRIDKIAVDKEIKVALSAPLSGGALSKLGDALHLEACLILASAAEFQGQRQAPALDPDQPGLQLEEAPADHEHADHDHEGELV
jgi:hypothetical protein